MALADSGFFIQVDVDRYFFAQDLRSADFKSARMFAPDFFLSEAAAFTAGESGVFTRSQILEKLSDFELSAPFLDWREPSKDVFSECFVEARRLMEQGAIEKIVPAVFAQAEARFEKSHIGFFVDRLLEAPEFTYAYGFWRGDEAVFGATPEILFHVKEGVLSTMALAGTRPRTGDKRLPLLEDEKELSEHRWVVRDLTEKLGAWGEVSVGTTGVLNLPSLQHLKTELHVELKGPVSFPGLMEKLHPTPALGGYPASACLPLLKRWSPGRLRFGAPFGVQLSESECLCLVAIRNIQFARGQAFLGSGCGLVKESRLDREWDELARKRQSVLQLLELA